jgi:hypothetical protein
MRKNVIILTTGLSGSSVLTGLIARAGYWTGEDTFKKADYDTFENQALIRLNLKLFQDAGYTGNYLLEYPPKAMRQVAELYGRIDCGPYGGLLDLCNAHRPWIWKDPRLWLTIRFWKHLLDLDNCRFILLTRGLMQSWISSTLRRQITTYGYQKDYELRVQQSIIGFLAENHLGYLHVEYERLIQKPSVEIDRLNAHLETRLTVDDLKCVYHKPLYKNPRNSWLKHVKAMLIYLKNYSERRGLVVERE